MSADISSVINVADSGLWPAIAIVSWVVAVLTAVIAVAAVWRLHREGAQW